MCVSSWFTPIYIKNMKCDTNHMAAHSCKSYSSPQKGALLWLKTKTKSSVFGTLKTQNDTGLIH